VAESCPVCPFRGLTGTERTCPSCGTDLSVLRRVQHLPEAILEDGIRLACAGDLDSASSALQLCAAFARTRAAALTLLLGWGEACPYSSCRLYRQPGRGNIVLYRRYGADATPLWRCRSCGHAFSGNRASITFGSRSGRDEIYAIVADLLEGRTVEELAAAMRVPARRIHRLALRALELGPDVVAEVAAGARRPPAALSAGWDQFARQFESAVPVDRAERLRHPSCGDGV
jgi:hypothetical protein